MEGTLTLRPHYGFEMRKHMVTLALTVSYLAATVAWGFALFYVADWLIQAEMVAAKPSVHPTWTVSAEH
jgi:hypothetical protein